MSLSKTSIEYGTHNWNFLTGCANGTDICKTRETCWAQTIAGRFHRDFTPQFHEDKFNLSFPRKPGARILVCFTGDISWAHIEFRQWAYARIVNAPQHTFILLTKRPKETYLDISAWPSNAWLGVSLTGTETPERQQQVMDELRAVTGQHKRWISYEPMLGPLSVSLEEVDWLVIGAQGGKGAVIPERVWRRLHNYAGPRWYKNNLPKDWFLVGRRQELPYA